MLKLKHPKTREEGFVTFDEAMSETVAFMPTNLGQKFDEFLADEGMLETVKASSIKRVIAFQLQKEMKEKGLTKIEVAKRMKTSRSQLDRILDPTVKSINLDLIIRAAHCIGRKFTLTLA